jgi:hypothetical protein
VNPETKRERDRCVAVCRRRAALWRRTEKRAPAAGAKEQARARANEATYLADLLESGQDLEQIPVVDGDKPKA